MDDQPAQGEDERDDDVVERRGNLEVGVTEEGWGVWDYAASTEPVARFADGDTGFEAAYAYFVALHRRQRQTRLRRRLQPVSFWVAIVSGAVWITSSAVFAVRLTIINDPFQSAEAFAALRWIEGVSQMAYPVFFVAFATFVMLWLGSRETLSGSLRVQQGATRDETG